MGMLLNAQLSRMRRVKMRLLVTLPLLDVPRNPESSVPQLAVDSSKELRSVMTRPVQLSKMLPRKNVVLSLKELVAMLLNLSPSLSPLRSVLMYPRRSVPDQEPTQERSRSLLSRNGAMLPLKNLAWHKWGYSSNLKNSQNIIDSAYSNPAFD